MKTIKNRNNLYYLFILISSTIFSQTHNAQNNDYLGTWEYQNGNQIFRINIWEDTVPNPYDSQYYLKGNYKMIEKNDDTETIIYSSNPNGEPSSYALNGIVNNEVYSGVFNEKHTNGFALIGNFEIKNLTPSEISFRISKMKGINIYPSGITPKTDFEVPIDVVLIKML